VPQAYYNKIAGTKRLATETGAGQWGSSLAMACSCSDWNAACTWSRSATPETVSAVADAHVGATVHGSPSGYTEYGKKVLRKIPMSGQPRHCHQRGDRGHRQHPGTKYSLGSVLNHVCMHQTVIGQEAIQQMVKPVRSRTW